MTHAGTMSKFSAYFSPRFMQEYCLFEILFLFLCSSQVDLSERGLKKEDFFMKIQSQINLQEVTDLILRKNEFDSFLDCSTNLANLEILDLSQNHLQRFFFLCKDEYNLRVLNVSHNKLEYIDDNAFNDRIPKLKILDLSSNKLSIVNETMLEHFKVTVSYLIIYKLKNEHTVNDSCLLDFGISYVSQQSDQRRNP